MTRLLYDKVVGSVDVEYRAHMLLAGRAIYECTDASAWYWTDERVLNVGLGELGRIRPGYACSWWEYQVPPRIYIHRPLDGGPPRWETTDEERYGFLVLATPNPDPDPMPEVILTFVVFADHPRYGLMSLPCTASAPITALGDWSAWSEKPGDDLFKLLPSKGFTLADVELVSDPLTTNVEAAMAAIGLSNARNVRVAANEIPSKVVAKRSKKLGYPAAARFHTIHLPGSPSVGRSDSGTRRAPAEMRRVRGHLKHYTADAPLLGKHVGTWWWADRVGTAPRERTEYQVAAPTPQEKR